MENYSDVICIGNASIDVFILLENLKKFNYDKFSNSIVFPLGEKIELVKQTIPRVKGSSFSVYGIGDHSLFDGGWVSLFVKYGLHPNRSYLNGGWDFIYRTHSLYSYNPDQKDGDKIVIFHDINNKLQDNPIFSKKIDTTLSYGKMSATILDNKEGWCNMNLLK